MACNFGFDELDWVKFREVYEEYLGILDIEYEEESKIRRKKPIARETRTLKVGHMEKMIW